MKELNRLKIKFVFFNMVLVTAILIFALIGGLWIMKKQVRRESQDVLARVAMQEDIAGTIFETNTYARVPYFSVVMQADGEIVLMDGIYNSFQGDEFLEQIAWMVAESGLESGELDDYQLRFRRVSHPTGHLFIFADTSYENLMESSMMDSMILICVCIWICLFVISCVFAYWAVKPVEESIIRQKQFVADASHELKTPLTVIAANAELLASACSGISKDADKWIRNMNQECKEMRVLIENLLMLARQDLLSERKKCRESCNLSELAEESVLTFEPVFFQNKKEIDSLIEENQMVCGNENQVRTLLRILLDNAVKYSDPGSISMVTLKRISKKKIRLHVSSKGKPIPDSEKKAVFRRFYRSDRARSSGQGFGLGLAIACEIVKACGAKIGVETELDGNCFYVVFQAK